MPADPSTDELLARAEKRDPQAIDQLFQRHRNRLKRMVCIRLDNRLRARIDPSDVVQETLAHAAGKLPEYLRTRPVDFYPWLRQIAWNRLIDLHRKHLAAKRRSVRREEQPGLRLPDESIVELAGRLVHRGSSPSRYLVREEIRARVRQAVDQLKPQDREVLVLIYLEQLRPQEVAQIVGASEKAVNMRHLRALERLRATLGDTFSES
ncbi:MAG: sigma-70 family RNA polymerase sigma factor [Pirellulales bacterium]